MKSLLRLFPIAIAFSVSIAMVIMMNSVLEKGTPRSVDRTELLLNIETALISGAELQDVKQIFDNRKHTRFFSILDFFENNRAESKSIYKEPVELNSVLKDLKSEIFLRKEVNKELVQRIKTVLAEHEKSNPYDKLESSQRIHFESIQSKLGDVYPRVQQDINFIVDEMSNKNQLVTKYLGDATLSFRLSIIALTIGVLAFIPQIVAMWRWFRPKDKAQ